MDELMKGSKQMGGKVENGPMFKSKMKFCLPVKMT